MFVKGCLDDSGARGSSKSLRSAGLSHQFRILLFYVERLGLDAYHHPDQLDRRPRERHGGIDL